MTVQVKVGLLAILCFVKDVLCQVECQSKVELWFRLSLVILTGFHLSLRSVSVSISEFVFVDQCQDD